MNNTKEVCSFLKKRTKKLLLLGVCGVGSAPQKLTRKALIVLFTLTPTFALADAATVDRGKVTAEAGAQIYQHVCQGCHMPGGRGASGAGAFPALANNPKLAVSGYPVVMVLNGHGGMPWFNGVLKPDQIAAVVNYVRTNFGNHYTDAVSPEFVAAAAGPPPTLER